MKSTNTASSRHEVFGWVLFVFSAVFFISSSIRSGDFLSLIGGVLFLIACFVFIIPLASRRQTSANRDGSDLLVAKSLAPNKGSANKPSPGHPK